MYDAANLWTSVYRHPHEVINKGIIKYALYLYISATYTRQIQMEQGKKVKRSLLALRDTTRDTDTRILGQTNEEDESQSLETPGKTQDSRTSFRTQ